MSAAMDDLSSDFADLTSVSTSETASDAPSPGATVPVAEVPADALAFALDGESRAIIATQFGADAGSRIFEGDVRAAIEHLSQHGSPPLLIVDISEASDPMVDLDGLADVCTPGTVVIALGAANDVALYRQLRSAGVADYLVKPLTTDTLGEALRSALSHQAQLHEPQTIQGKLFCIVGARGGSGASTLATNLAAVLARDTNKKVGLIDLDLQFGTIALQLDVEASQGLREALENPDRIDSMFVNSTASVVGERLHVLATEEGIFEPSYIDAEHLSSFLAQMRQHFDVVVVDVPLHAMGHLWPVIGTATKLLIVTDLSLSGLRDTGRLFAAAKNHMDASRLALVANRVGADRHGFIDQAEFERALERKFDFVVPDDPKAAGAASRAGKAVVDMAKDGRLLGALRKIAGTIVTAGAGGKDAAEAPAKRHFRLPFMSKKDG
jgi:pilus assembly protein CpaE